VKKTFIVLVVVATGAVAAAIFARSAAGPGNGTPRGPDSVVAVRRDIGTVVKATGVIRPMVGAEVRVGSRVSGVVRRLLVRVGDSVRQGQLLAELDDRELSARLAEAVGGLERAQANLAFAQSDLRRKRQLHAEGLLPPADLEVGERAAALADKEFAQARANRDYSSTQLSYARIVAPISGVVASVATQEGETVAASFAAPTFLTLLDLRRLEVRAYVDETDIGRIRRGQVVRFTVDTYPGRDVTGRVVTVYPQAEIRDNVVDYVTVVNFTAPPGCVLRPEMTAAVRISVEEKPMALAVPVQAVRRDGAGAFVLCARAGTVERRVVTTGARDEGHWEITSGLREGERVLVGDAAAR
jgi:macrolide-specific efflux system membrane fusion protein